MHFLVLEWSRILFEILDNFNILVMDIKAESNSQSQGLVSLFNGISTLFRLFNAKPILL